MIKKVNFIYYSLSLLLQAIIYYILILYISFLFSKEMNYYFPLLIIPTLILVYLSRKFSKNIIILFLTHIPILLLPLIFNVDVNYKIIFLFSNIFILGFSISYWNNSKIKEIVSAPKLSIEILFILILLITNTKNFSYYLTMTLSIIYLVICYIAKYLAGMRSYIYYNAYLAEFPIHKVLKLNNTYLTGILSIGIISGIFIKVLKIDKLLYFIFGPVLKFLLGVLQYIINTIIHLINSKEIKPKKIPAVKEVAENLSENSALDNPVYKIIITIFSALLFCGIIAFIIYCIYSIIKGNLKKFQSATDEISQIEVETENSPLSKLLKSKGVDKNCPNNKIRKKYYKKIIKLKKKDKNIKSTLTHNEINTEVKNNLNINIDELTLAYEKARYDK